MRHRVYVSGAMSGIPKEVYKAHFMAAEKKLRERDFKVSNPVRWVWFLRFFPYKVALAFDILMMTRCDRIFLLEGWNDSNGANAERSFAVSTGMIIEYER